MQSVIDIINEVCADICDYYCKYTAAPGEYSQSEVEEHCRTCPLNRLAQEEPKTTNTIPGSRPVDPNDTEPQNCMNCGRPIEAGGGMTSAQVAEARFKKYGMPICQRCANVIKERQKANEENISEAFGTIGGSENG